VKLVFDEATEMETTYGRYQKIGWITAKEDTQSALRYKCRSFREVETKIAQLRADLDQILAAAKSYLAP
jgi:hypothetical protein